MTPPGRIVNSRQAQVGLTTTLQGTLRLVAAHPGHSAAELARQAMVRPQSMAHAVFRPEQLGLLARRPHPVHGRIQQVELTSTGHKTLKQVDRLLAEAEEQLWADLTTTERDQFLTYLN